MNCIFCKIAAGEILSEKVYEDEHAFAFLDIEPRVPGHTMVILKKHAENILEVPQEDIGPYFTAVQRVVGMVKKALSPDGFTLGINHGKVSGQTVDHLHFHIMPRWKDDGGRSIHSVVSNPPKEDLKTIGEKIRNAA